MSELTIEEQQTAVKMKSVKENLIPVANTIEMVVSVISRVAGKDISDTLGNGSLSRGVLGNLVANRIKEKVLG